MTGLESIAKKEEEIKIVQAMLEKPVRRAEKFFRTVALGAGIALKCTAWYLGLYQSMHYTAIKEYRKAAVSHASGYAPGIVGSVLLGFSGISYSKDFLKSIKKKLTK